MNQFNTITMPEDKKYLSQIMNELPTGIFNKKITATGATTLAMENEQNVILLCPNIGLILNKIKQYKDGSIDRCNYEFLAIYENVDTTDVIKYINRCKGKQPVKLLATYDALFKVLGITNIFKDYHLIIDEYHELFSLTNDREIKAIKVLTEFSKFKKYTFLSATPIKEDFLPAQLESIPYTELLIEHSSKIKVIGQQTDKPFSMVVDVIKNFKANNEFIINDKTSKHLYFFINSVTTIASIIKGAGLTQADVNIYCGDYSYNDAKLEKVGCENGELLTKKELFEHPENEKPIHFITSKGYKGIDIYSNDGVVFYATNCHIKSTYSGMEALQQISGRIRTESNPFNGIIYHIYNINKASLTYDEYLKEQQLAISDSKDIIKDWKIVTQASRNNYLTVYNKSSVFDKVIYYYYDKVTDNIYLNDLRIKRDQHTHKVENLIYTQGIEVRKAYIEQGFENYSNDYLQAESSFKNIIQHKTFKEYCLAYNESLTGFYMVDPLFGCPGITKEFIIKAFSELGFEKIKDLKFHQTNIKKQFKDVIMYDTFSIIKAVDKAFILNGRYSNAEIKMKIQAIYDRLEVDKKAKATSINEYFEGIPCKLQDRTNGLMLVKRLFKISNELKVA